MGVRLGVGPGVGLGVRVEEGPGVRLGLGPDYQVQIRNLKGIK